MVSLTGLIHHPATALTRECWAPAERPCWEIGQKETLRRGHCGDLRTRKEGIGGFQHLSFALEAVFFSDTKFRPEHTVPFWDE